MSLHLLGAVVVLGRVGGKTLPGVYQIPGTAGTPSPPPMPSPMPSPSGPASTTVFQPLPLYPWFQYPWYQPPMEIGPQGPNAPVDDDALVDAVASAVAAKLRAAEAPAKVMGGPLHLLGAVVEVNITTHDLMPFVLTELPSDDIGLSSLYRNYLGAFDNLISSVVSGWHPVDSNAAYMALQGARQAAVKSWGEGTRGTRIGAVQLLASLLGYFNARFRDSNGDIDWHAMDGEVNASITASAVNAAVAAGQLAEDVARDIADTAKSVASTGIGLVQALIYGAIAIVALAVGILTWQHGGEVVARARR